MAAVLVIFVIHQIAVLALFSHELPRGKHGQPFDALGIVLAVLVFPFYVLQLLDSYIHGLPQYPYVFLYVLAWILSGACWAAIALLAFSVLKRYRKRSATSTI
ncbi:MAG: hypothetical protein H0W34_15040 [Pyrinomonadaceae bacterium]|nr:hypothetical protein [Chthoniobacterales bacterium]MBA3573249.1 hypothetical protein [Pyrinomonadaceae bacterium]